MTLGPVLWSPLGQIVSPVLGDAGGRTLASLLFGNGEDGFLFGDFSELPELFTTFTGPTNVAADNDLTGLALDDHSWGGQTFAQVMAAQPELWPQPDFASSTNLTLGTGWSVSGGFAVKTAGTGSSMQATTGTAPVAGQLFRVQFTITGWGGSGTVNANVGGVENLYRAANNTYVEYIRATGTGLPALFAGATFSGSISSMSVKLVPGNHGLTSSGTARPAWRSNSGNPYLQPDGSDDNLLTSHKASAAMTYMAKVKVPASIAAFQAVVGVLNSGARAFVGFDTNGRVAGGSGNDSIGTILGSTDRRGQTLVIALVLTGSTVALIENNVTVYSGAQNGAVDTTFNIAIGATNNAGVINNFSAASIYGALAVNRALSAAEIAIVTTQWGTAS